jgi:hypothetical protein
MGKIIRIICIFLIVVQAVPRLAYAQNYNKDLSVSADGVRAVSSAISGKIVRIYATVSNNSAYDLFGVVKFYDENRKSFISTDQPVSVVAGKTDDVFVDWLAGAVGDNPISVRIMPWDESGDDSSNNKVTKNIYVDIDSDGDGIGNRLDADDDNDGTPDIRDTFPLNSGEWLDTDGDGIGDNADTDDDNDGVSDTEDAFPLNSGETKDTDGDGAGDNSDKFPDDPKEWADSDSDGLGDNSDPNNQNHGPVPEIGAGDMKTHVGETMTFNALKSNDPDGEVVTFEWNFGDGKIATGVIVDHVYESIGEYNVTLTVTDDRGESRKLTTEITVIYKWQTIALMLATTLIVLLFLVPWLFSRRKNTKKAVSGETDMGKKGGVKKPSAAGKKKTLPKKRK